MIYYYITIKIANIKNTILMTPNIGEDMEKLDHTYIVIDGDAKCCSHSGNSLTISCETKYAVTT
jgi:hypothetical protein